MMKRFYFDLMTTYACNLLCKYCFQKSIHQDIHLQLDTLYKAISVCDLLQTNFYFKKIFSKIVIKLFGGEPLLNSDIITHILQNTNYDIFITTNGTLLSQYKDLFLKHKDRIIINVSFNGQYFYEKYVSKKFYKTVAASIMWLDYYNFNYTVKFVIPRFEFVGFAKSLLSVLNLVPKNKISIQIDCQLKRSVPYSLLFSELLLLKELNKNKFDLYQIGKQFGYYYCNAGNNMVSMDVDGNIYVCHNAFVSENKMNHYVTNIYESSCINDIISCIYFFKSIKKNDCDKKCYHCSSCPLDNYDMSNRKSYKNKICDYNVNNVNNAICNTAYNMKKILDKLFTEQK